MARHDTTPVNLRIGGKSVRVDPAEGMRIVWVRAGNRDLLAVGGPQLTVFGPGGREAGQDLSSRAWDVSVYTSRDGSATWVTGELDPSWDRRLAALLPDVHNVRVTVSLTPSALRVYTTVAVPQRLEPLGVGFTWRARFTVADSATAIVRTDRGRRSLAQPFDDSQVIRQDAPYALRLEDAGHGARFELASASGPSRVRVSSAASSMQVAVSTDDRGGVQRYAGLEHDWIAASLSITPFALVGA
jgi:hypothetical protein